VKYTQLTFAQLDRESDAIARGLSELGIADGVRTSLFVKPGLDFYAITFALFKTGAVPVLIDPGMGRERLLHCLVGVEPEALIGIAQAQLARLLFPKYFRSVKTFISVGRRWCWGGYSLAGLKKHADEKFDLAPTREEDLAAILFTTGSTGPAKGVAYEHGMFEAQCQLIGQTYGIGGEDIDLPTFPLFGLFSVALGMTAVIPDMDPTRPAHVEPEKIIEAILNHGVTNMFASPALLNRVGGFCRRSRACASWPNPFRVEPVDASDREVVRGQNLPGLDTDGLELRVELAPELAGADLVDGRIRHHQGPPSETRQEPVPARRQYGAGPAGGKRGIPAAQSGHGPLSQFAHRVFRVRPP